jgi:hypothetical protein
MARFTGVDGYDAVRSRNDLSTTAATNFEQQYNMADKGLASMARMRAANYLADAQVEAARTDANSSIFNGVIGGLSSLGLGAIKGLGARPTLGAGQPSAPSINTSNPNAGERALMGAQYKLY